MPVTIDLSIVIVNWNVEGFLRDCIKSIYRETKDLRFDIWVVDNNSSDCSVTMLKNEFPDVKIIENHENLGFAKANNQAIRGSNGRYALLLNPDTVILPNALNLLIDYMDKNKNTGAAGGKLLSANGELGGGVRYFPDLISEFFYHAELNRMFPKSKIFGHYSMSCWNHNNNRDDIDLLSGALMIVRRKTIEEVGLLDENIFMYAEDVDWCYRIKKAGWNISFVSDARVIHYGEKSAEQCMESGIEIESLWSKYYYFKKHNGVIYAFAYRLVMAVVYLFWSFTWFLMFIFGLKQKREVSKKIMAKRALFLMNIIRKPKLKGKI